MNLKDAKVFNDHYASGKYPQPTAILRGPDPDSKYFLAWARFIYSLYCGGVTTSVPDNLFEATPSSVLRDYARGKQDINKYRGMIDVQIKDGMAKSDAPSTVKSGSLLNISWRNWAFYPKYRALAISQALNQDYAASVRAIDSKSSQQRRERYAKAKLSADPRMKALFQASGVVPDEAAPYQQMTPGDVDTIMETGGFSIVEEALMEDVVGCTFDLSNWQDVRRQLAEDLVDLNRVGVVIETVYTEKRLRLRYADAASFIIPISNTKDRRDDGFRAFVERVNISTLRADSGLSEKELWSIANSYSRFGTNAASRQQHGSNMFDLGWRENYAENSGQQVYEHFAIDVMNFWFIANKVESSIVRTNPDGSMHSEVIDHSYTMSEEDIATGATVMENSIQYVYRGKWVIGTDKVFCCGVDDTIVREGSDGSKRAVIPFVVWASDEPSITENCISIIDDIQLSILKIRMLVSNLPPGPRMLIDMSVLDDSLEFGGKLFGMKDLLKIFGATGKLLVRTRSEFGGRDFNAANKSPITPIASGVQEDFTLFSNAIAMGLDQIRQTTGLNEVTDGTGSTSGLLNGVARGYQSVSNNALRPITSALESLYMTISNTLIKRYQALSLFGEISINQWPVDATTLAILTLPENIHLYNFVSTIRMLPTEEEVQLLTQQVLTNQQQAKITEADVFIVMNMLRAKDVKKAEIFLSRAVAQGEMRAQQAQTQAIQAQAQANAEAAQLAEQAKQQTLSLEFKGKAAIMEQEYQLKEKAADSELGRDLKRIEAQSAMGVQQSIVDNAINSTSN